jgi:thymidylate synthase (FAD)
MSFLSLRRRLSEEEARFPSKPMWEIDQVAQQIERVFADRMPLTHAAFVENGYVAP